jgi:hypothetical protein
VGQARKVDQLSSSMISSDIDEPPTSDPRGTLKADLKRLDTYKETKPSFDPIEELKRLAGEGKKAPTPKKGKEPPNKPIKPKVESDDEAHDDIWREKEEEFYQFGKEATLSPKKKEINPLDLTPVRPSNDSYKHINDEP